MSQLTGEFLNDSLSEIPWINSGVRRFMVLSMGENMSRIESFGNILSLGGNVTRCLLTDTDFTFNLAFFLPNCWIPDLYNLVSYAGRASVLSYSRHGKFARIGKDRLPNVARLNPSS